VVTTRRVDIVEDDFEKETDWQKRDGTIVTP
jgi:hypothetical protein